jgi:hypothetical protein
MPIAADGGRYGRIAEGMPIAAGARIAVGGGRGSENQIGGGGGQDDKAG